VPSPGARHAAHAEIAHVRPQCADYITDGRGRVTDFSVRN
jgi:hypothetical protein